MEIYMTVFSDLDIPVADTFYVVAVDSPVGIGKGIGAGIIFEIFIGEYAVICYKVAVCGKALNQVLIGIVECGGTALECPMIVR